MAAGSAQLRILVVDDNHHTADGLGYILRAKGYAVRVVYSVEEAVVTAEEFNPDAAISEVAMSGMNGADLAIWLNAYHPACRLLLVSGQSDTAPPKDASPLQRYLNYLLPEPIDLPQLLHLMALGPAIA